MLELPANSSFASFNLVPLHKTSSVTSAHKRQDLVMVEAQLLMPQENVLDCTEYKGFFLTRKLGTNTSMQKPLVLRLGPVNSQQCRLVKLTLNQPWSTLRRLHFRLDVTLRGLEFDIDSYGIDISSDNPSRFIMCCNEGALQTESFSPRVSINSLIIPLK